MMAPTPPAWADLCLRLLLPARDRDTVSGDLMEEYRESIRPTRSKVAADLWYIMQVSRFAWRIGGWGAILSALYVSRMAYDWFMPTSDFEARADVTTLTMVSTLLVVGASSALRTQSLGAGILHSAGALLLSATLSAVALSVIYAAARSAALDTAVANSGGLAEAIIMPFMVIVPGTLVGSIGSALARLRRPAGDTSMN